MMTKKKLLVIAAAAAFCVALVLGATVRVGPTEAGVKINNVSLLGSRGIVQEDFSPGWHLTIPGVHRWNIYPANTRRVEMTRDSRHRSPIGRDSLVVQSADGDRVMLDLDIFFRIKPGMAHRVLADTGPGDAHVGQLRTLAADRLRGVFGTLHTEDFYNRDARQARFEEAKEALQAAVDDRHLEVLAITLQYIEFEPKYEQKIKDKKLADQQAELARAQERAAAEKAKMNTVRVMTQREVALIETEATAEVSRIRAEAEKDATEVRADAELYRSQLTGQATLALGKARAEVQQSRTRAMAGSGGSNLAALEAVQNIKVDSIEFPTSGGDWFDVNSMAGRLGARSR